MNVEIIIGDIVGCRNLEHRMNYTCAKCSGFNNERACSLFRGLNNLKRYT
jgi:hypothetical protein